MQTPNKHTQRPLCRTAARIAALQLLLAPVGVSAGHLLRAPVPGASVVMLCCSLVYLRLCSGWKLCLAGALALLVAVAVGAGVGALGTVPGDGVAFGAAAAVGAMFLLPVWLDRCLVGARVHGDLLPYAFAAAYTASMHAVTLASPYSLMGVPGSELVWKSSFAQLLCVVGLPGVFFLCALFSALAAAAINAAAAPRLGGSRTEAFRHPRTHAALWAAFLFALWLFSGLRDSYDPDNSPRSSSVRVAGVLSRSSDLKTLLDATRQAAQAGAKVVLWTEYATDAVSYADDPEDLRGCSSSLCDLVESVRSLAQELSIYVVPSLLVSHYEASGGAYRGDTNRVLMVAPNGDIKFNYAKAYPLPNENVMPGSRDILYADTEYGRIGAVICMDSGHPFYMTQAGRKRLDILLIPSNDWEDIYRVTTYTFALRGVENGCAAVRLTKEGRSIATDALGNTLLQDNWFAHEGQSWFVVADIPQSEKYVLWVSLNGNVNAVAHTGPQEAHGRMVEWVGFRMAVCDPLAATRPGALTFSVHIAGVADIVASGTVALAALHEGSHNGAALWNNKHWWGNVTFTAAPTQAFGYASRLQALCVGFNGEQTDEGRKAANGGADNDARGALAAVHRFAWPYEYEQGRVYGALVGEGATSPRATEELLVEMAATAGAGDVIFFFYSGMGAVGLDPADNDDTFRESLHLGNGPSAFLCFHNTTFTRQGGAAVIHNGLSAVRVARLLEPALQRGATAIVVLDCCFSSAGAPPLPAGDVRRYKCLPGVPAPQNPEAVIDFPKVFNTVNGYTGVREMPRPAEGSSALEAPSISVGSVLDTLLVGADQTAADGAGAAGEGRWVDIARGAQAFGAGIVEAAKRASATRDVAQDRAATEALEGMTPKQWATVLRQAIDLDPQGMRAVVDSVAGGLDASPARRQRLMRDISDSALVSALSEVPADAQPEWGEPSLALGAGGDQERLRRALQDLPYQRKLEMADLGLHKALQRQRLVEDTDKEDAVVQATGKPWVALVSQMLAQAPDATRSALSREIASHGVPGTRYSDMLRAISNRNTAAAITAIREASLRAGTQPRAAFALPGSEEGQVWSTSSRGEFVRMAQSLCQMPIEENLTVYMAEHVLSLLPDAQLSAVVSAWATRSSASQEAERYHRLMHEASHAAWCAAIGDVAKRVQVLSGQTGAEFLSEAGVDVAELERRPWMTSLQWWRLLMALVQDNAVALQAVGDVLGRVAGRRVDTEEIGDAEGEGLAELVRQVSDSGYARVIAELAQRAPSATASAVVEAMSAGVGVDRAAADVARTLLAVRDSPVSYRTVLHDAVVAGQLRDAQIAVEPRPAARPEAGAAQWLPTDGDLGDLDSVHAYATVRLVVDAFERALLRVASDDEGDRGECTQELAALDEGRSGGGAQPSVGLRWQVGGTLRVDTRATGAAEPTYSRSAGGLLFPVRDYAGDGAGPVSTSRALDVVAHTAGYAVLDALRPALQASAQQYTEDHFFTYLKWSLNIMRDTAQSMSKKSIMEARVKQAQAAVETENLTSKKGKSPTTTKKQKPKSLTASTDINPTLQLHAELKTGIMVYSMPGLWPKNQDLIGTMLLLPHGVPEGQPDLPTQNLTLILDNPVNQNKNNVMDVSNGVVLSEFRLKPTRQLAPNAPLILWVMLPSNVNAVAHSEPHVVDGPDTVSWGQFAAGVYEPTAQGRLALALAVDGATEVAVLCTVPVAELLPPSTEVSLDGWGSLVFKVAPLANPRPFGRTVWALLVGVNRTDNGRGILLGAVNDADAMRKAVRKFTGCTAALLDTDGATKAGVSSKLREKAGNAKRDDVLLFFFSGMGTLSSAPAGPDDTEFQHDTTLRDDGTLVNGLSAIEVARLLDPALRRGATAIVVLDCCFSGSGSQAGSTTVKCLPGVPAPQNPEAVIDFAQVFSAVNGYTGVRELPQPAGGRSALEAPSISVGSVLDTLLVGADQTAADGAGAAGEGRWVDIARGAQAFGAGIVEAAKRASATRDVAQDSAATEALEGMTPKQWATVLRQAIDLDPQGMRDVVDSVAGGLDASPARRQRLMRDISDSALVSALSEVPTDAQRAWEEPSLVLGAGGDEERLRRALQDLPYQRKLEMADMGLHKALQRQGLVEETDKEDAVVQATGKPWVALVSQMLAQAPDATRSALSREIASHGVPGTRYSDMLRAISNRNTAAAITAIREASLRAGTQPRALAPEEARAMELAADVGLEQTTQLGTGVALLPLLEQTVAEGRAVWPEVYAYSGPSGVSEGTGVRWTTARDVCNVALARAFAMPGSEEGQVWSTSSRAEFVRMAHSLCQMPIEEDLTVYIAEHVLSLLPDAQLSAVVSAWAMCSSTSQEAELYHRQMHEASHAAWCAAIGDVAKRVQVLSGQTGAEFLGEAGVDVAELERRPWMTSLQWWRLLMALVQDNAVALQAVGDVLGRVAGRRVDTEEIGDAEGEGLAELVRQVSDSGYARVIAELAQRAPSAMPRAVVEAMSAGVGVDRAAADDRSETTPGVACTLLAVRDSPVSYRTVLHDAVVAGQLHDAQIAVEPRPAARPEAGAAQWLPTDGDLGDLDSVHAYATVRLVVDAFERALLRVASDDEGDRGECTQELAALDEGRSGGGAQPSVGLRWQVGGTLRVDTRATGAAEPTYSRSAGGLLFPVRDYAGDGAGPVSTSRALDVVAHTAGYAVLDALRPAWAAGLEERPEGGVLHEAFADLTALLVALGAPAVCGAVVAQTRCDLRAEAVARRQQAGMGDALGASAVRSACSRLTGRDVWEAGTGQPRQTARRWSSREVSAMVTSAVWGAIAAELARRCRRAGATEGAAGAGEDPAEVLCQLAQLALRALVAACLCKGFKKAAPTLVQFCDSLVGNDGAKPGESKAESCESEIQGAGGPARRMCECIAAAGAEARSAVECPVSRQLWEALCRGAQEALATTTDDAEAWEALSRTWMAVERRAAGQVFGDRRLWTTIVVEPAEKETEEGSEESVKKLVLSLEYVVACCSPSDSLRLWGSVLSAFTNANTN
eukprot:m51a1_g9929 putative caspase-like protein (3025) ;mRNA; r:20035-47715